MIWITDLLSNWKIVTIIYLTKNSYQECIKDSYKKISKKVDNQTKDRKHALCVCMYVFLLLRWKRNLLSGKS